MTMVPAMASCRFLSVVRTMLIDFCAGPRTRTRTRTRTQVSGAAWGL